VPKPEGRNYRFSDFDRAGWDYFASMTEDERWEYGIAALADDAPRLDAALAPGAVVVTVEEVARFMERFCEMDAGQNPTGAPCAQTRRLVAEFLGLPPDGGR
jgi:hypothetical protein